MQSTEETNKNGDVMERTKEDILALMGYDDDPIFKDSYNILTLSVILGNRNHFKECFITPFEARIVTCDLTRECIVTFNERKASKDLKEQGTKFLRIAEGKFDPIKYYHDNCSLFEMGYKTVINLSRPGIWGREVLGHTYWLSIPYIELIEFDKRISMLDKIYRNIKKGKAHEYSTWELRYI